jgi:hypothetical protein
MKNLFIVLYFLLLFTPARSQSSVYHHFPDSGFIWIEEFTRAPDGQCCCSSSVCTNYFSYQHYLSGDSITGGYRYQHLYETGFVIRTNSGNVTCTTNNYSPCYQYFNHFDCALIREDSAARQVFILMPGDTMEELFYDFNMNVGDSVRGKIGSGMNYVSAIDSVQVGTDFHKRYWVTVFGGNQLGYDSAYATITEGLGGSQGVMMPLMPVDSSFGNMICAYNQNVPVWPASQPGCLLPTGNRPDVIAAGLAVFPNPANDRLDVYTGSGAGYLALFDMQGRIVLQTNVSQSRTTLTLPDLPHGLYTIRYYNAAGHNVTRKIVIQ